MRTMRRFREWIKRNERRFMLVLVVFLLVIFTVTSDVVNWLKGGSGNGPRSTDVVGSFALLPLERQDVTRAEFQQARAERGLTSRLQGGRGDDRLRDSDVWTFLLLKEAAKKLDISVTDSEVRDQLRRMLPPYIQEDVQAYKTWVQNVTGLSPREFEETLRTTMAAQRVLDIHAQGYVVAPPTTVEDVVRTYAGQILEYLRVSYAALDAEVFLDEAKKELAAEKNADAVLREFFEKDPAIQAERAQFQNPRGYKVEFLYTLHSALPDPESYERIERLFHRAYPELDVEKLEATEAEMHDYFGIYRDRLLEQMGTSWAEVQKEVAKSRSDKPTKDDEKDDEKDTEKDTEKDDEKPDKPDEPDVLPSPELQQAWMQRGFEICKDQVMRELKVRGMYQFFHDEADKQPKASLKALFEKLQTVDDKENPVCSTELGRGLIVLLAQDKFLSGDEIEEITDRGVAFTHNVRFRVNQIGDTDLPKIFRKADTMGEQGHGRMIIRLLEVKQQSRKTFGDLEPREKEDLRAEFYLPSRARDKAKARLETLRKQFADGTLAPEDLAKAAGELGCRVREDEWITASPDFMTEPDKAIYWSDAYLHMRDRHFLRTRLATSLGAIREGFKESGMWLDVEVDSRAERGDPGAAYLVLVLERRPPSVDTMPQAELRRNLSTALTRRRMEGSERWTLPNLNRMEQLFNDFEFEFYGDMKDRINDEKKRRLESEKRAPSG